jgi:hypothetical protein
LLATQVNADKVKAVEQYKGKCEPVFMFYKVRVVLVPLEACTHVLPQRTWTAAARGVLASSTAAHCDAVLSASVCGL